MECKQALPADQKLDNQDDLSNQTTKIFVGGIPQTTTESSFKKYFEQFGKIEESFIMVDRATSKSRGFGFVTFTTVGAVERVIDNYDDNFLDGKWVKKLFFFLFLTAIPLGGVQKGLPEGCQQPFKLELFLSTEA